MKSAIVGKLGIAAAVVGLGGAAFYVQHVRAERTAEVGVELEVPRNDSIRELKYTVEGPGVEESGTVEVPADARRAEFKVGGLKPGSYRLVVEGKSAGGKPYAGVVSLRPGADRVTKISVRPGTRVDRLAERGEEASQGTAAPGVGANSTKAAKRGSAVVRTGSNIPTGKVGCPNEISNIDGPEQLCQAPYAINDCGKECAPITSEECLACERRVADGTANCEHATGTAMSGPSKGVPRAELCNRVVECMRATSCGKNNHLDCYCGPFAGIECFTGTEAKGACKQLIEAALETTNGKEIAERFGEATFGGGVAILRITSNREQCAKECFPETL